jgi:peptidyl-prolyl cis-trans isomerase C
MMGQAAILNRMMKFIFLFAGALAWAQQQAPPPAAPAPAAPADPVVLTIGTQKITASQFEAMIATLPAQQRAQITTPEQRRKVAESLAELETLAQEARVRKLDQNPEVKTRLELQTDQVLANAEYQILGSVPPDDAALHAFYDSHKDDFMEVTARHILIRFKGSQVALRPGQQDLTEAEALQKAKDLRAKIVAGAKFEDVAKAESDDAGSGANGGDLGKFTKGRMVPEFEKAAFAQPIGQVGEPVKSQFGYHLILVEKRESKPFEQAKAEILQHIGPDQAKKGLEDLKKKTPVVYDETFFGKAPSK